MNCSRPFAHGSLVLRNRQAGATLIVGLVLLLVLTVLGVSGMNTATMEITMAGNAQFHQDAFQMAEDAIDNAVGRELYSTAGPRNVVPFGGGRAVDRQAVINYTEVTTPIPDSVNSVDGMQAYHFDILSTGVGPRTGTSVHTQAFYVRGRVP